MCSSDLGLNVLLGPLALTSIKARCPGRGDEGTGLSVERDVQIQGIAPHQPTRGVNQHLVAHCISFRIQTLQDPQWAMVQIMSNSPLTITAIVKLKAASPAHAKLVPLALGFSPRDCARATGPRPRTHG